MRLQNPSGGDAMLNHATCSACAGNNPPHHNTLCNNRPGRQTIVNNWHFAIRDILDWNLRAEGNHVIKEPIITPTSQLRADLNIRPSYGALGGNVENIYYVTMKAIMAVDP